MDDRLPPPPAPTLADRIAAAQAWWREAGVDFDFSDEPRAWLAEPAPESVTDPRAPRSPRPAPEAPPAPRIGGAKADWPQDLTAFREWWLEEPSLDPGGVNPRVPPRGPVGAPLAMLVPMPEAEDRDTLLSGAQGRLLASLALAMGHAPDTVYFAAALPRHMPLPDWEGLAAAGLGEVLTHHLSLAAPKRLLVLGRDVLPLLGHDPAQASPGVSELSIQGGQLPLQASYSPARLLENARLREGLWRRWLDWTEHDESG